MIQYAIMILLGLITLLFFTAQRSLGVFTWSRLEEIEAPRSQKHAAARCMEERESAEAAFLALGSLALAGLSVMIGFQSADVWRGTIAGLCTVIVMVWILPEFIAGRFRDFMVLALVPPLYGSTGGLFRLVRRGLIRWQSERDVAPGGNPAAADASDASPRTIMREATRLRHTQLREILTPRTEMVSVSETSTLQEAARICMDSGYSRLPVYRSNRDQIIGILHAKDLLKYAATDEWNKPIPPALIRPPVCVPETKVVSEFLTEILHSGVHMAVVLDEYGGTGGIVTLEDVLEELLGDIRDEHESPAEEPPPFKRIGAHSIEVQATMRIADFNEEFEMDLPEDEGFDTIGGFVTYVLGKIPATGETYQVGLATITVLESEPRRVIRVRVDFPAETRGE